MARSRLRIATPAVSVFLLEPDVRKRVVAEHRKAPRHLADLVGIVREWHIDLEIALRDGQGSLIERLEAAYEAARQDVSECASEEKHGRDQAADRGHGQQGQV